jgi:hypothetical protein
MNPDSPHLPPDPDNDPNLEAAVNNIFSLEGSDSLRDPEDDEPLPPGFRELAVASRGWTHVEHVTDPGASGKRLANRKGLMAALDKLDAGEADVLVAAKIDRGPQHQRLRRSAGREAGLEDRRPGCRGGYDHSGWQAGG